MEKARIAIVGAGPAGSAAGYHLAVRGNAVALIDRAPFPRDKTCGDWLTPAALWELSALGLDRDALALRAPGHAVVGETLLAAPDGRRSVRTSGAAGACVPRRILDAAVRERALSAGCEPVLGKIRDVGPRGDPYLAAFDLVIDARGATAGVANAIGVRGYLTVPSAATGNGAAARVELHTDAAYPRGYGWIFPVRADTTQVRFNIGVGLWKDDSRTGHTVADFLDRFLAGNKTARSLCAAATESGRPVGYPVALGLWTNRVAHADVLRIGDAANLADPLTGDGIGNALASGRLVAQTIAEALDARAAALDWQRVYDRTFAPEFRRALILRRLLLSTPAKNLATRMLERGFSAFGTRLHRAVFGEAGYRDLLRGD